MTAAISHRDDDAIDVLALYQRAELTCHTDDRRVNQALAKQGGIVINEAYDAITRIGPVEGLARDVDGKIAGTDNQNPFTNFRMPEHPMNRQAPANHQRQRQW